MKSRGLRENHSELFTAQVKAVASMIRAVATVKKCIIDRTCNKDDEVLSMPLNLALLSLIGCVEGECRASALQHASKDVFSLIRHGPSEFRMHLLTLIMSSISFLETKDDDTSISGNSANLLLSQCLDCAVTSQSKVVVSDILSAVNASLLLQQHSAEVSKIMEILEINGYLLLRGKLREHAILPLILLLE